MTPRQWVDRHTTSVTLMCVVVMVISLGWIVDQLRFFVHVTTAQPRVWFYDLNTQKLFITTATTIPPIETRSGPGPDGTPAGVLAKVFSYSDCSDPSQQFIGWLEKRTPQVKEEMTETQTAGAQADTLITKRTYLDGLLVRPPDGFDWVRADSAEGRRLMQKPRQNCPPGSILNSCFPD